MRSFSKQIRQRSLCFRIKPLKVSNHRFERIYKLPSFSWEQLHRQQTVKNKLCDKTVQKKKNVERRTKTKMHVVLHSDMKNGAGSNLTWLFLRTTDTFIVISKFTFEFSLFFTGYEMTRWHHVLIDSLWTVCRPLKKDCIKSSQKTLCSKLNC